MKCRGLLVGAGVSVRYGRPQCLMRFGMSLRLHHRARGCKSACVRVLKTSIHRARALVMSLPACGAMDNPTFAGSDTAGRVACHVPPLFPLRAAVVYSVKHTAATPTAANAHPQACSNRNVPRNLWGLSRFRAPVPI